jgi:membrane-associated phospholipid phosphatase
LSVVFAVLAGGLAAAAYWFGAGTDAGRDLDAYLLRHGNDLLVELAGDTLVFLVNPVTAVVAALVLLWHAEKRGRRADGLRAALIIGAAAVASWGAKRVLGDHDPLGDEALRALGPGFFPSGHATVAMALCFGALLVLGPPRRELLLALGTFASVLGFSIAAGRSHHLSDVYGGFLLAAAVGALGLFGRSAPRAAGRTGAGGGGLTLRDALRRIGLFAGVILALEFPRYFFKPEHLPGEAANAIAVALPAFALVVWFAWLVRRTERG